MHTQNISIQWIMFVFSFTKQNVSEYDPMCGSPIYKSTTIRIYGTFYFIKASLQKVEVYLYTTTE